MKQLKNRVLGVGALCLTAAMSAVDNPGFALRNKSDVIVSVKVKNGAAPAKSFMLPSGGLSTFKIDITQSTTVTIGNTKGMLIAEYGFTVGKTLYLNWNDKIYPQRGPLMGLTSKTDEGYPLKNNVQERDIFRTR